MIKKVIVVGFILVAALAGILFFRHTPLKFDWTSYDGKLARLDLPVGWKTDEYGTDHVRRIDLETKTKDGKSLFFLLAEYLPSSGKTDIEHFVKGSIAESAEPQLIVVKQTSFGRLPAREFSTYMPETIDLPNAAGVRVFQSSYTEMRHLVFARENGLIYEVAYTLPEKDPGDYDPVFRKIVDSIQFK